MMHYDERSIMTADDSPKASKHGCHIIGSVVARRIRIRCNSPGLIEMAVMETDTAIRMNTLVHPWAPIHPITQRRHHLTDDMVAGAPTFRQILTDLITITAGRAILAYNSGSAFDTVIREAQRAGLDPEHLEDRGNWRSIAKARSNWLRHPDHYLPISPTPRALGQCHAALNVLRDIAAD
jgi:DNA polymerase III epsilon subunit-like protein